MNLPPSPLSDACSFLFVPATQPERYGKALASGADGVIIDLEDAVGLYDKAKAREILKKNLAIHFDRPETSDHCSLQCSRHPLLCC